MLVVVLVVLVVATKIITSNVLVLLNCTVCPPKGVKVKTTDNNPGGHALESSADEVQSPFKPIVPLKKALVLLENVATAVKLAPGGPPVISN